jgi:hypothetical protein
VSVGSEELREAVAPLIHQATARERFAFIHAHRGRFGLRRLCRVLVAGSANLPGLGQAAARRNTENSITDYNRRRLRSSPGYQAPTSARHAWQNHIATAL